MRNIRTTEIIVLHETVRQSIAKDLASAGRANAARERIWFSPHCLKPDAGLLAGIFP